MGVEVCLSCEASSPNGQVLIVVCDDDDDDDQLEHDPGAPPKQAWRRKLNICPSILKEFSVTFIEAIRMVISRPVT